SSADATDGIVAYGWTTAALFAAILHQSPAMTRSAVMETARTLKPVSDVGLQLPGSKWSTSATHSFLRDNYRLIHYNLSAGHTYCRRPPIDDSGKAGALSPSNLLNQ